MAHLGPSFHHSRFNEPDHFPLERHHPGIIAAWAIGLVVLLSAIGVLTTRLRAAQHTQTGSPEPTATSAVVR